jgi:hypothetical protein
MKISTVAEMRAMDRAAVEQYGIACAGEGTPLLHWKTAAWRHSMP